MGAKEGGIRDEVLWTFWENAQTENSYHIFLSHYFENVLIPLNVTFLIINGSLSSPLFFFFFFWLVYLTQVVFEAIRGKGYRSDIALDEISIYPGPCITAAEPLAPTTATLHTTSKITPLNGQY